MIGLKTYSFFNGGVNGSPSNLLITILSDVAIKLDWTNNSSNEDGISVESSDNGTDYTEITTTGAGVATYTNSGLTQGTAKYYRVRAFKGSRYNSYSNVVYGETYQTEAYNVFTACGTDMSQFNKEQYNVFVKNLKSDGIWAKLDYLNVYAMPTADASLINWITPGTKNPVLSSTPPTFQAYMGYTGGATKYINTGIVLAADVTKYTQNSASIGCYSNTNNKGAYHHFGVIGANNNRADLLPYFTDDKAYFAANSASTANIGNIGSDGMFIINRTASNALSLYRNGVSIADRTTASAARSTTYPVYVLGINNKGTLANASICQVSMFFIGQALTPTDITNLGNRFDTLMGAISTNLYTFTEIFDDSKLIDGVVYEDRGSWNSHTSFSNFKFETNAVVIKVKVKPELYASYPAYSHITVIKDGTILARQKCFNENYITISLGSGTKTIQLIEEAITKPASTVIGTYITSVLSSGATNTILNGNPANRIVVLADSIANGAFANYFYNGWAGLFRQNSKDINVYGWGFASLFDMASNATKINTTIGFLTSLLDGTSGNKIVITVGTNDYGLNKCSASDYATYYENLLDAIISNFPTTSIYCLKMTVRTSEVANNFGDTLDDYRDAIDTAATGKSNTTVVNGKTMITTGDLVDSVHPTTTGHSTLYTAINAAIS